MVMPIPYQGRVLWLHTVTEDGKPAEVKLTETPPEHNQPDNSSDWEDQ